MFWDMMDFCMKLLKAEWKVNQQEGGDEFNCYMIWQMIVTLLPVMLIRTGHELRHDGLLHEITEGRMWDKPTRWRIQMLHDLANDDGFVALKWAAEDREGWRHRERMSKTCCTTGVYWWWWWWWWERWTMASTALYVNVLNWLSVVLLVPIYQMSSNSKLHQ